MYGDDYFISFSFVNINSKIIISNFDCSKALTFDSSKKKYLFKLPLKKDIKTTCKEFKEEIITHLLKNEVIIYSNEEVKQKYIKSRVKLTFLPKRFDIIIKNGFVEFYLKE